MLWKRTIAACGLLMATALTSPAQQLNREGDATKTVVVELFTSQGCNMCPSAEKLLASLPSKGYGEPRVVVLAFHVDYFNDPWRDPFSTPEFSRRNLAYDEVAKKRDRSAKDLYFTPMIMVAGKYPTSGYFHEGEKAAWDALKARLDRALNEPAEVSVKLSPPLSGGDAKRQKRTVSVSPLGNAWAGKKLLVEVAVVEDGLKTSVPAGENEGKELVENHVVRSFDFRPITLKKAPATNSEIHVDHIGPASKLEVDLKRVATADLTFDLELPAGAMSEATSVVAFVQDEATGAILQADVADWVGGEPQGTQRPSRAARPR